MTPATRKYKEACMVVAVYPLPMLLTEEHGKMNKCLSFIHPGTSQPLTCLPGLSRLISQWDTYAVILKACPISSPRHPMRIHCGTCSSRLCALQEGGTPLVTRIL